MLNILMKHVKHYSPIILPRWQNMIRDIDSRQENFIVRYLSTELGSYPNIVLIENILKNSQEEILNVLSISDQFNRCVYLMEPKTRMFLEQVIDDVRTKVFYKKTFFNSLFNPPVIENIIPVTENNPLLTLPLMNYELNIWSEVNPVKVIYYDSLELISNLIVDPRVKFKKEPASIGIVTVDVISLILKFANYVDNHYDKEITDDMLRTFVKEEVFIHIHKDMIEIWMMNVIQALIKCENEKDLLELENHFKSNSLVFADFHNYFSEIYKKLQEMKEGKIPPMQFLSSKILYHRSIIDRVNENLTSLKVRELIQYKHNQLCIDIPNIKLMILFLYYSDNKYLVRTVKSELTRKINQMNAQGFLNKFKSVTTKKWLMEQMTEIINMVNAL